MNCRLAAISTLLLLRWLQSGVVQSARNFKRVASGQRTSAHGGRVWGRGAAVIVVLPIMLLGCGGSSISSQRVPPSRTPVVPLTPGSSKDGTSPTTTGQDATILASYLDSLADFVAVATTMPLMSNSPRLGDHMAGAKLSFVIASLTKLSLNGQVDKGTLTSISANVTQFSEKNASGAPQAIVQSCERDNISVVSATTGQVIEASSGGTELIKDLLQVIDGIWKVVAETDIKAGCG